MSSVLEMLHDEVFFQGSSLLRSLKVAKFFADKAANEKLGDEYAWQHDDDGSLGWLEWKADLGNLTACILVFSREKLEQDVGLYPFEFEDDPGEEEEQTSADAKPVSRYILSILANRRGFKTFSAIVLEHRPEYAGAVQKMRGLLRT